MKAILAAILFIAISAVGADYALNNAGFSAAETYQGDNVRLGD